MPYAEGTTVSPERSQMEIAALIRKYGAGSFVTGWDGDRALVEFIAHDRRIRFVLTLPTDWRDFILTPKKVRRTEAAARQAMEAETRRRWRSLANAIRAKLDVVETGISTFEEEFLPHTVMPNGQTVAEMALPAIEHAIATGVMPEAQLLAIEGSR